MPDGPCLDPQLSRADSTGQPCWASRSQRRSTQGLNSREPRAETEVKVPLLGRCTLGRGALQVAFSLMLQEQVRVHLPAGLLSLLGSVVLLSVWCSQLAQSNAFWIKEAPC